MTAEQSASSLDRILGPYMVLRGNRDFVLIFAAHTLSAVIDWLYVVALFVLAYYLTHSATVVALLTFVRLLPYALVLPVSGTLTDRFDRKVLMVAANVGRALCILALLAVHSRGTLPLAFPLVFATTLLASLFRPALLSLVPELVPERQLIQANSVMGQVDMASFGAGPALAGFILLLSGTPAVLLTASAGLLFSAGAVLLAHLPAHPMRSGREDRRWLSHTVAGLQFLVRQNDGVLLAMAVAWAGLTLFGGAYWAISVVLAVRAFHLGGEGVGFLNGVYAVGGLLGGFLVAPIIRRRGVTSLFVTGAALSSIAEALFGLSPAGVLPFIFWCLVGLADACAKIVAVTIIQMATPRHILGRVFGAFESVIIFSMVVGSLVVGPLIAAFGARAACVIVAITGLSLLMIAVPRLLRLERILGVRIFLHQVPALGAVSFELLDELADRFRLERFPARQTIIRQGDPGNRFYIVKHGRVEVVSNAGGDREVLLAGLSRMDYFGETALLRDVPRTATVRSRQPVELYSLSREDFQELLQRSEALERSMRSGSRARDLARQNTLLAHL